MEIAIPDPSMVVLVGAAGAGKSSFAARHFHPSEILSSDRFRGLIAGDESDQTATRPAFARLHRELTRRLEAGRLTVVDATNIERAARRALLKRSVAAGVPAVAIVLDLPSTVVLARNAARAERVVNPETVRHHLERLRHAPDGSGRDLAAGLHGEGFSRVVILRDPREVDASRIVRLTG